MKLSITDYEATLLKNALKNNIMMKGILGKIDKAKQIQQEMQECNHKMGYYEGKKVCCIKCQGLPEGEIESWILDDRSVE